MLRGRGARVAIKYVPKTVERVITRLESVSYSVARTASGSETNFCLAIASQASVCMGVLRDGWGRHAGTNVLITGSARLQGNPCLKRFTSESNDFFLVKNTFCTIILYFCISAFNGTLDRKLRSFVMYLFIY